MWHSRTRRAISCAYCAPKSTTRTVCMTQATAQRCRYFGKRPSAITLNPSSSLATPIGSRPAFRLMRQCEHGLVSPHLGGEIVELVDGNVGDVPGDYVDRPPKAIGQRPVHVSSPEPHVLNPEPFGVAAGPVESPISAVCAPPPGPGDT